MHHLLVGAKGDEVCGSCSRASRRCLEDMKLQQQLGFWCSAKMAIQRLLTSAQDAKGATGSAGQLGHLSIIWHPAAKTAGAVLPGVCPLGEAQNGLQAKHRGICQVAPPWVTNVQHWHKLSNGCLFFTGWGCQAVLLLMWQTFAMRPALCGLCSVSSHAPPWRNIGQLSQTEMQNDMQVGKARTLTAQ